jgi:thioredoxin 1
MTRRLLLLVLMAAWTITYAPGCGGGQKPVALAKTDTVAAPGTVCDTTLVPDSTTGTAATDTGRKPQVGKPKATPDKSALLAEKPKELPRMWDFGSVSCLPCKTMKEILDPMMVAYKGKVDIRIINVYEDKPRTQQFRIVTIPTQVFMDAAGKELFRHIGVYPRDSIEARFRQFNMPVVGGASAPTGGATGGT